MMRLPPGRMHISNPATGDAKINTLIRHDGTGATIKVTQAIATKVGHHLTEMAQTNPRRAAALVAHIITLEQDGKLKIPAGSHGMQSAEHYALFQDVLTELNKPKNRNIAREYDLPPPSALR